jgi:methyl-accepting chemotaxis protein
MELLKSINMKLNASARTQATIFNVAEETRGLAEEARSLADEARGLAEETRALAEKTRARAEETRAHADAFKEEFGTIGAKLMEVSDLMKATHRIAQEHSGREETDGSEDDYESPSGSSGFSGEEGDE